MKSNVRKWTECTPLRTVARGLLQLSRKRPKFSFAFGDFLDWLNDC